MQKLTELGVDAVLLLVADRSVVRWEGGRRDAARTRLERVAREAAMQCRRCTLPRVEVGVALADVTAPGGGVALADVAAPGGGVALAHLGGPRPSLDRPCVLVGPEGGWSDAELSVAPALVGLGSTTLRAETAAVVAGSLLVALRAGLVAPGPAEPDNAEGG